MYFLKYFSYFIDSYVFWYNKNKHEDQYFENATPIINCHSRQVSSLSLSWVGPD